jgi:arginase
VTVRRLVTIIGAPSGIGIRPYVEGGPRRLDLAPATLRELGLVERLDAVDLGDVAPPPRYQDLAQKPVGRARNEEDVAEYTTQLAAHIARAASPTKFVLLLGGDCSILLGAMLGVQQARRQTIGLVYIDAHADFATLDESPSGSACSMTLALAVGRTHQRLARLNGDRPLVRLADVVHIGRRDDTQPEYGCGTLATSAALNLPHEFVRQHGGTATAQAALERLERTSGGFWIHCDADVLDPAVMPAVDTPLDDGLTADELADVLGPLVRHPQAVGLQVTIYDPTLDPDRTAAACLVSILERALTS